MQATRILFSLAALALSGCTSARLLPLAGPAETVFISKLPTRPYREVAYVEATGSIFSSRAELLRQLQRQQAKAQADALVQVRYDFVFWWPHAGAVAVRFE